MKGLVSPAAIFSAIILQWSIMLIVDTAHADVRIVRDGTKGPANILIEGTIKKGDLAAFKHAVDSISQTTVFKINGVPLITIDLDSPGGDVMEAIEIGRIIRSRFLTTGAVKQQCSSACVFILIAGVMRAVSDAARIGLHRPYFDPAYFSSLSAEQARSKYNELVEQLRRYFFEMGGDERAFRILMRTPSDKIYFVNEREIEAFEFRGNDPAWQEHADAQFIQQYGRKRWPVMKRCLEKQPSSFESCRIRAFELYPND